MKLLAKVLAFVIATTGGVGVIAPSIFLDFGDSLLIPEFDYIAVAVPIFFGVLLFWLAPVSRTPVALRVIGVLIVLAGMLGAFIGLQDSRAMLDWLMAQEPWITRAWAGVPLLLGLFIAYALTSSRRFGA